MGKSESKSSVLVTTAWGQPTTPLTDAERSELHALGNDFKLERVPGLDSIADIEETLGDPNPVETWTVWRALDGSWLGSEDLPEVRGYLRWLIAHKIRPEAREDGQAASIGEGIGPGGAPAWFGWSHRAAAMFRPNAGHTIFTEAEIAGREDVPIVHVGSRPVLTMADAREAAVNFAAYIS
jgi:hypothetical protein